MTIRYSKSSIADGRGKRTSLNSLLKDTHVRAFETLALNTANGLRNALPLSENSKVAYLLVTCADTLGMSFDEFNYNVSVAIVGVANDAGILTYNKWVPENEIQATLLATVSNVAYQAFEFPSDEFYIGNPAIDQVFDITPVLDSLTIN
jgi:hypothetical protein